MMVLKDYQLFCKFLLDRKDKEGTPLISSMMHNFMLKNSPPSIAEFDGKLIKFIVKGVDYYEIFPEIKDLYASSTFVCSAPITSQC